jgi:hypothetical protein
MFSSFRNRFGIPGLISVIALVFAMLGGAYAASGALTGKQKKEVTKIAKKYAGKPGATGPAGPQGPAGANGKDGANGTNGANGKSVAVTEVSCGGLGGAEIKQEGAGSGVEVCNGEEGSPWTLGGTLPSEETLTGGWSFGNVPSSAYPPGGAVEGIVVPISFPIPLADDLDGSGCELNGGETEIVGPCQVHFIDNTGQEVVFNNAFEPKKVPPADCPGAVAEPLAEPGHLCVYAQKLGNAVAASNTIGPLDRSHFPGYFIEPGNVGGSAAGALINFPAAYLSIPKAWAFGSWAVTAE